MNIIAIDTVDFESAVGILINGKIKIAKFPSRGSQLLAKIDKLLKSENVEIAPPQPSTPHREALRFLSSPARGEDQKVFRIRGGKKSGNVIDGIVINLGPGESFTGQRVGLAVANTLSYAKNIPMQGFSVLKPKDLSKRIEFMLKNADLAKMKIKPLMPVYSAPAKVTKKKQK
jgi:hypothetical protein